MGRHSDYMASPTEQQSQNLHRVGYTVDTVTDLATITTGQEFMLALVRDTGKVYYQDSTGVWHLVGSGTGGGDWQESVLSRQNTPPGSPGIGDRYIVTSVATGLWTGKENNIAEWDGIAWEFTVPNEGFMLTVEDENLVYYFTGTVWTIFYQIPFASTTEVLQAVSTTKAISPASLAALWIQGTDVPSAASISLGDGGYFNITGSVGISTIAFATDKAGRRAFLKFAATLTLTNSGTLILPTSANIATSSGDIAEVVSDGAGVMRVVVYTRANGAPLALATTTQILQAVSASVVGTPAAISALWIQGANIPSASSLPVGDGGHFHVTGTTAITAISVTTDKAGRRFFLAFDGILTLTNGASLILPTGANITTAVGDVAEFVSEGAGVVRCVNYMRADGTALVGATFASATEVLTATNTTKVLNPSTAGSLWTQGAAIPSAASLPVGNGGYFHVTGTTTITAITFTVDTGGRKVVLVFDGVLTLTNGASLILPTGANITTAAGDSIEAVSEGAGVVRVTDYRKAAGTPVGVVPISQGGTGQITARAAFDALAVHGADIPSAGTVNLSTATGDLVDITGTTTITTITLADGNQRIVRFTGALTLTNGASLVLPGGANITTAAGDYAIFAGYAAGVVRCVGYFPADGSVPGVIPITKGGTGQTTARAAWDALATHGADIPSAATLVLTTATGDLVDVTGTTTITAITLNDGNQRIVRFTGILTLTNGASLVLPGGANITTAAGDYAIFAGYAAGVVRCVGYFKTSGTPVGVVPIGNGGTGQTTAGPAYDALTIHGADVASATTTNLDTATGNLVDVTGVTTITTITLSDGRTRYVRFTGSLLLTNGASLVLPDSANIQTAAGDYAIFRGYAAGVVRCVGYFRLNNHGADVASATTTNLDTATGEIVNVTGTTTITGITLADGRMRVVRFTGSLLLTNGASLVLPDNANWQTQTDDVAVFIGYPAGVVRCLYFTRFTQLGASVASASTLVLDTTTGEIVDISGTTTITAITLAQGRRRVIRFSGILTLTNGASLVLPTGANITTAANDFAVVVGYSGGVVRVISYMRNDGTALVGTGTLPKVWYSADQLDNPINANWAVNALAPLSADTVNAALPVRRFDDTTQEGVGFMLSIPSTAVSIKFNFKHRPQTAPGGSVGVVYTYYVRTINNNAAISAWSAAVDFATQTIPANANFQYATQTITLATLGITAGNLVQFEITRRGTQAGDTLTGDLDLTELQLEFL